MRRDPDLHAPRQPASSWGRLPTCRRSRRAAESSTSARISGRSAVCSTRCSPARRAFAGAELSDTLAFVLTKAPDWTALPAITPPAIRLLLRRCLEKDRTQRLAAIADARLEIDDVLTAPASDGVTAVSVVIPVRPARWRRALPWALAAILGIGWVLALGRWAPWRTTPPLAPQRLSVELGVDGGLATTDAPFVLSPDGTLLAFVARTHAKIAAIARSPS